MEKAIVLVIFMKKLKNCIKMIMITSLKRLPTKDMPQISDGGGGGSKDAKLSVYVFLSFRVKVNGSETTLSTHHGPTVGALNTESPQQTFFKTVKKHKLVTKNIFLRICTIFCMREATYISDDFRMRAGPLGP